MYSWICCRAWNLGCCRWNMAVSIALESELPSTWHIVARGIWNEQLLQPSSHPYATAPHEGPHTLLPSFLQPSLFHNKSNAMYVTKTLSSSLSLQNRGSVSRVFSVSLSHRDLWWSTSSISDWGNLVIPNGGDHQIASATDVFYQCKSRK